MAIYEVIAQSRKAKGTSASRLLRNQARVPGIVYGGKGEAQAIDLEHNALFHQLKQEKFHASILTLVIDGKKEQVLLRAVNMHPWKMQIQHVDFQRVAADQKIHMKVPLHFVGAEVSPAVKSQSAMISHIFNELSIRCLPGALPEFIEVDLSGMTVGHSLHVRDIKMPPGVEPALRPNENPAVAVAQVPRAAIEEEAAAAEAAPSAADVPAAKQKEPAAAPAAGKDDKGGKK